MHLELDMWEICADIKLAEHRFHFDGFFFFDGTCQAGSKCNHLHRSMSHCPVSQKAFEYKNTPNLVPGGHDVETDLSKLKF